MIYLSVINGMRMILGIFFSLIPLLANLVQTSSTLSAWVAYFGNHPFHDPTHHLFPCEFIDVGMFLTVDTLAEWYTPFKSIVATASFCCYLKTPEPSKCGSLHYGSLSAAWKLISLFLVG